MELGRAIFALKKYSWSNNGEHGKANYNHLTADNIFLVLEGEQHTRGRLKLQIIQGTVFLAEIDVAKHIDIAISTRETFQRIGKQVADKQLPTYGVASGNKLAITYRPDDGQARRMQVALVAQEDCTKIATHLRYRGMVFVDAAQRTASRSGTAGSDIRSINTIASPSFTTDRSFARPPAHEPSQHASHTPSRTYAPSFLAQRSADTFLSRDEGVAPRIPRLDQPTASQIFPRITTSTRITAGIMTDPIAVGRPDDSTASLSKLFADRPATQSRHDFTAMPSFFSQPAESARTHSTSLWMPARSMAERLPQEQEPDSERTGRERSRSSSMLEFEKLPKPRLANPGSDRTPSLNADTSTGRERSTPSRVDSFKVKTSTGHEEATPSRIVSLRTNMNSSSIITRAKRKHLDLEAQTETEQHRPDNMPPPPPQVLPSSEASRSSPRDMHELLYGKRPRTTNADASDANKENVQDESSTPLLSALPKGTIRRSSECVDLARWAALDEKERGKALERSITDLLGNKDFATLCEAMSTNWSRLALDL
ncbi:hypothetical protein AMS68_006937 [Peltaster fructicola]|uniref:Uncharacterized protein n=1 Tax=Peltaster fructicola TaxID=286661 RepID=A0A6H0Y479_9PEZI|nr:hypothetical protein AMS68_006937 [Peltaster fructicola]